MPNLCIHIAIYVFVNFHVFCGVGLKVGKPCKKCLFGFFFFGLINGVAF